MPSYKSFRNDYKRSTEQDNLFTNPKSMKKETEFSQERKDNLIDWITFYRRNVHRFVEHYFGIKLYPYQILWLYWMSLSDSFVAICSRAVGKTWLLAVLACARAVLYPNSEIVVVSSTKEQAGIIVSDKISSLYNNYPNLAREISNIVTNMNKWEVVFHNGSVIRIVASRDSSRGKRSTFTVFEEFRLISRKVIDEVVRPFAYIRQAAYLKNPKYEKLGEEPKEVYISSAYLKNEWWFLETKKNIKAMLSGDNAGFIAIDLEVAIRHHIKSKRQVKNEISKMDSITAQLEMFNIPYGQSSSAYFKLKMFNRVRTIKKAFFCQRPETYNAKKNPYSIHKTEGEIRLLSCDISSRSGKENDLSITDCIRLLPSSRGYFKELVHVESYSGRDSINQSIRIKEVFYDFDADYIVLDVASGIAILDQLGIVTKNTERGIEYPPMCIIDHPSIDRDTYDELKKRTLGLNAIPTIYPISATARLNSTIATELRDGLQRKMWSFLVDEAAAEDYLIRSAYAKEYLDNEDIGARSYFMQGYVQTSLTINECINLSMTVLNGLIRLTEPVGGRRDRYSSLAYANHFAHLLDQELIREEENVDDFDLIARLVQSV